MSIKNYAYFGPTRVNPYKELLQDSTPSVIAIDTETVSIEDKSMLGLGIATSPSESFYFPAASPMMPIEILSNPSIVKVFHNAMFDLQVMRDMPLDYSKLDDTMVMASFAMMPLSLAELAIYVGGETTPVDYLMAEHGVKNAADLPEEVLAKHCCQDVQVTYRAWEKLKDKYEVTSSYYKDELKLFPILEFMSRRGVAIDSELVDKLREKYSASVDYYKGIAEGYGFNPHSPQQVAYILTKRGCYLPLNDDRTGLTTNEISLHKLDDPVAALVLNYRKVDTILSRYIEPIVGCSRVYSEYHINAATKRISSRDRNLQNIPTGECRNTILPDTGWFTDWDYSQIELRILAYLSQDPEMLRIFADPNGDIHQETADYVNIDRKIAKTGNFGMIYGCSEQTFMDNTKIYSRKLAHDFMVGWRAKYYRAYRWMEEQQELGLANGYVTTLYGRNLPLPMDMGESHARSCAVNYPIQGTAAEVMKMAIRLLASENLAIQVYDQLVIDGNVEVPKEQLEHLCKEIDTPITVKRINRWE